MTAQSLVQAGDSKLYAQWLAHAYTVRFDANGGEGAMSDQAFEFDKPGSLDSNAFVRACHDFVGWATNATGEAVYADGAEVSNLTAVDGGVVELFATWARQKVNMVIGEGAAATQLEVGLPYGDSLSDPAAREGRTFGGWFTEPDGGGRRVTSDSIVEAGVDRLYAHWLTNSYTVHFDANGGEGGTSEALDYGTALSAPTVAREGYTFDGWSPDVAAMVPAGDVTYTAQWKVNQYTVTFDANGGTGDMVPTNLVYDVEYALPSNLFENLGYSFAGWSVVPESGVEYEDGATVSNLTAEANGTVQLHAYWTVNQYTVTFDANSGEGGMTTMQDYGTAIAAPTVTREGYAFDGWSPSVAVTVPAGDVTYTAQWTAIPVPDPEPDPVVTQQVWTVTFDVQGGVVAEATRAVTNGCAVGKLPVATWDGHTFGGWFTASDGGGLVSDETVVTTNVTFYAHWTAIGSVEQTITISRAGWNLVSFNVLPDDPSPGAVFAEVADSVQSVISGTRRWTPQSGGRLATLQIGVGYWVKTTRDNVEWTIRGASDEGVEIKVNEGWNLIGYPLLEAGAPETVLRSASEAGIVSSVVSGTRRWTPQTGGRLTEMAPGVGYWLKAAKAGTIVFDK